MKLEINGKEYPLQWGMGALEMFCDALDCEIDDIDKALNPGKDQNKYLTTLILSALKNGADAESYYEEVGVSYRQLQRFLDEAPSSTLPEIMEDFKRSKYFGKTIASYLFGEEEEEEGPKKKSPSEE